MSFLQFNTTVCKLRAAERGRVTQRPFRQAVNACGHGLRISWEFAAPAIDAT
jgi:hypothetical protein